MRILVTGASGDFGREVVRRLLARGADVVAFARRPPKDPRLTAVAGNICDLDAVTDAMRGADVVVHFAWALEPLPTEEENRAVNVGGTANVLEAMSRVGCDRLVFSSSVMAYGSHADNPEFLREDDPLRPDPRIYYAAQKAEVESMIAAAGVPRSSAGRPSHSVTGRSATRDGCSACPCWPRFRACRPAGSWCTPKTSHGFTPTRASSSAPAP